MKRKLLILLASLMLISCTANKSSNSFSSIGSELGYDQLKLIPSNNYDKQKNYSVTGSSATYNSNYELLNQYFPTEYSINVSTIAKYNGYSTITSSAGVSNKLYSYSGFTQKGRVYLSYKLPIFAYEDVLDNNFYIYSSKGEKLFNFDYSSSLYYEVSFNDSKTYYDDEQTTVLFELKVSSDSITEKIYFKNVYHKQYDDYSVSIISKSEYVNFNNDSSNSDSNLIEHKISKNKSYYTTVMGGSILLYNNKKKYVATIPSISWENLLITQNSIYSFETEEYYESALNKGSEEQYKTTCYKVDLDNGTCSISTDFKYIIKDIDVYTDSDGYYVSSLVKYYELDENNHKGKVLKAEILTNSLELTGKYYYDDILNSTFYSVGKNTLLASNNYGTYKITKNGREKLNINKIVNFNKENVMFTDNNGLYHYSSVNDIESEAKNEGYYYMSWCTYNNERMSIKHDEYNDRYTYKDLVLNKNYITTNTFVVANNGIYIPGSGFIASYTISEFSGVSNLGRLDNVTNLYALKTINGTTYFTITVQ